MRRRQAEKRPVMADPKFNDELVGYLINCVMKSGKKSIAESIVYSSFRSLLEKAKHQKEVNVSDDSADSSSSESSSESGGISITSIPAHLTEEFAQTLRVFKKALNNICPLVELKSRRVGGATYQIPIEVPPRRRVTLGVRWLVAAARKRSEKGMHLRLAGELLDALLSRGEAVKKREDTYRMAKANQAFAHYRW